MTLKTDFQDDIAQVFLDPAEFGEEIDIDGTPVTAVIEEGHGSFSTSSGGGFADPAGLALQEATRTLYVADILPRRPVPEAGGSGRQRCGAGNGAAENPGHAPVLVRGTMLELHVDTRELAAIARPLSAMRGQLEKAVQAAVRRTGVTLRTDVIRQTAQVTYLQRAKITTAVFKPLVRTTASEIRAEIGVRGKPFGMDAFRLIPKRVTARRGRYSTGPGEGIRTLPARGGRSAAFVIRSGGRLVMLRRTSGGRLVRVYGYPVQYFAAFRAVHDPVERRTREMFEKRLRHEVRYRLEKR